MNSTNIILNMTQASIGLNPCVNSKGEYIYTCLVDSALESLNASVWRMVFAVVFIVIIGHFFISWLDKAEYIQIRELYLKYNIKLWTWKNEEEDYKKSKEEMITSLKMAYLSFMLAIISAFFSILAVIILS